MHFTLPSNKALCNHEPMINFNINAGKNNPKMYPEHSNKNI